MPIGAQWPYTRLPSNMCTSETLASRTVDRDLLERTEMVMHGMDERSKGH